MGQQESKEVIEDDKYIIARRIASEKGPAALSKYIKDNIDQWKKEEVLFAVTGRSATGKSTFINKIRDVNQGDPGFAKAGSGNTTTEATAYHNPKNERIVFWDLPGVGTMEFPKKTYVSKMKLQRYDYFFLFFDKVVSEDDYFLICKLIELKKSFCLVMSKIDEDLNNAEEDGRIKEEVIPSIRNQINKQLSSYEHLRNSEAIFLISSRKTDIGDWSQLLCHIEKSLPGAKFETLMFSLPTLTENVIDEKYQTLRKRIAGAVFLAATIAAIPIPELDVVANIAILVNEVKHYMNIFGLDRKSLGTLEECGRDQLKCAGFIGPEGKDLTKVIVSHLGKYAFILSAESVIDMFLPLFGSAVSATTASIITYQYLNSVLEDFREDARIVYRSITENQRSRI